MNTYIYKKSVDWSVLQQGFSIPVSLQIVFQQHIKQYLPRGTRQKIKLLIDNESYEAHLVNQNFDIAKYPTHKDIIQFRYTPKSATAKKMRQIFATTYHYCLDYKTNNPKRRQIKIAKEQQEYLMLYTTALQNTFLLDYMTLAEQSDFKTEINKIDESAFEMMINYNETDETASITEKQALVKVRKLNKSICDNLKQLYDFRCQITGENFCENYGVSVVEAHHIDYFTLSQNNDSSNILIVSPNYHRLIHKLNPTFDRNENAFIFPNGFKEKVKLNKHL